MSHFTVLVIGEDVEEQLAPFDENLTVEPYRSYWDEKEIERWQEILIKDDPAVDVSSLEKLVIVYNAKYCDDYEDDEEREAAAEDDSDRLQIESDEEAVKRIKEQYANSAISHEKMEELLEKALKTRVYQMSTYPPNAKWDWYQVGGRWRGFFKLKDGVAKHPELLGDSGAFGNDARYDADSVLKGHVDAEGMRAAAAEEAGLAWDRIHALLDPLEAPAFTPWSAYLARVDSGELTFDQIRDLYHDQPQVRAVREHDERCLREGHQEEALLGWGDLEPFMATKEEYVESRRQAAVATYAYLKDGVWCEPGRMGMFGASSVSEDGRARFNREFNAMFDALPDDALLTLVDCHI